MDRDTIVDLNGLQEEHAMSWNGTKLEKKAIDCRFLDSCGAVTSKKCRGVFETVGGFCWPVEFT